MTRDELLALRRTCPACGGLGQWSETYITADGMHDFDGGECYTCIGTGYVLPATEEVLEMAGVDTTTGRAGACVSVNPTRRMEPGGASASTGGQYCAPGLDAQSGSPCHDGEEAERDEE